MVTTEFGSDPQPDCEGCPACESTEFRTLFKGTDRLFRTTGRVFEIVECSRCRLIRLHPWPAPAELGQYYPGDYWFFPSHAAADRLEEAYRRLVLRDHVGFVRRAMEDSRESGFLLDVGCGGGLFLRMMAERGYRTIGLDFSMDAASGAWRQNAVPVVRGSMAHAPFEPASCATVTMFHVLEHLYDPRTYLESARDLLKPNGRLIVQVPNAACWQFLLLGESWMGLDVPRHLVDFRAGDLESLLKECGFEVIRRKYFSLRDNPAGFASSLAPGLDPMSRRVRKVPEGSGQKLAKDLLYFALLLICLPFTVLEAACGAGSTVMLEARKKA